MNLAALSEKKTKIKGGFCSWLIEHLADTSSSVDFNQQCFSSESVRLKQYCTLLAAANSQKTYLP